MSWYVARNTGWASEETPYVIRRFKPYRNDDGIVKAFHAQPTEFRRFSGDPIMETGQQVRVRAQAFCDQLNARGIARERQLREAER